MNLKIGSAVTAAVLALAPPSPAAPQAPLAFGLVRPDGILVPAAVYERGAWIDAWPEPADKIPSTGMIASVPSYWRARRETAPATWHVATASGAMAAARVLTHVVFDEHCLYQVGLLTDVQRREENSHVKVVALNQPLPVVWPAAFDEASAPGGWRDLIARVRQEVPRQETAAIAAWEEQSGRKSQLEPAAERPTVRIRRMYGYRTAGTWTLYYEAERAYKKPIFTAPAVEPAILVATGWIQARDGSPPALLNHSEMITDPDFKNAITVTPLGILTLDGATLWIVQEHGYESEAVSVLRVGADGVHRVFNKFIGGC